MWYVLPLTALLTCTTIARGMGSLLSPVGV
jgi:hypothetical protein